MSEYVTLDLSGETVTARRLTGVLEQARGCIACRSPPPEPMIWDYEEASRHSLHMLGVPFPLEAAFVRDESVVAVEHLRPWLGVAAARADTVIEYAPDAHELAVGDSVSVSTPPRKSASDPLSV